MSTEADEVTEAREVSMRYSPNPETGLCDCYACRQERGDVIRRSQVAEEEYKSQKIRGLVALKNSGFEVLPFTPVTADVEKLEAAWTLYASRDRFVRPCPLKPVHGYFDSLVFSYGEKQNFVDYVKACIERDPSVEFMVGTWYKAKWNAIVAPGRMVVGPGHDGATAGKNAVEVEIRKEIKYPSGLLLTANITGSDIPYMELVGDDVLTYATQLRAGPQLPGGRDFVPETLRVERIVCPNGEDLIAWAKRVAAFRPGTVVWHENGSLASHYGVHCVLNNVPYVVEKKPELGEVLHKTSDKPKPNLDAVIAGIRAANAFARNTQPSDVKPQLLPIILFGLHESPWLMRNATGCFLIGVAMDLAARCGMMAVLGERRHREPGARHRSRESIYTNVWPVPDKYVRKLGHSPRAFCARGWRDGYGGGSWAECAKQTRLLVQRLRRFVFKPTEQRFTETLEALNRVVTAAHNNGHFLNKFLCDSADIFDDAARGRAKFYMWAARAVAAWTRKESVAPCVWEKLGPAAPPRRPRRTKYSLGQVIVKMRDEDLTAHFQVLTGMGSSLQYRVVNVPTSNLPQPWLEWLAQQEMHESFAKSGTMYYVVPVNEKGQLVGPNMVEFDIE